MKLLYSFIIVTMLCNNGKAHADILYCKASYYTKDSCIKEGTFQKYKGKTANGEVFNENNRTAASWFYPLNSWVRVESCKSGKSIAVKITDRGPGRKALLRNVKIDLTIYAFSRIADLKDGVIAVKVERIL